MEKGTVISLSKSKSHTFNKYTCDSLSLVEGMGVQGDAHMGEKVKHRSRVARDPNQPNLRQVHLIHAELFEELGKKGFAVNPGQMGENITTKGIDLLSLPTGTILTIGNSVKIQITGLRNPCRQIDTIQQGLMKAVLDRDQAGNLIRKAGIMGIVLEGGDVHLTDEISAIAPPKPHKKLEAV